MKLTTEDRRTLAYLSKQTRLIWGGVLDRGGEADLMMLEQRGLIEVVKKPVTVGKSVFSGGYRITNAGRKALRGSP